MTPEEAARLTEACFPESPWKASEIRNFLDQPTSRFFCRDAGFLMAQFVPPEAEIQILAVSPDARRQGIGASLVTALIARCIEEHVTSIFLDVCSENSAALALYGKLGFEEVGRRKGYYVRNDWTRADALLLRMAVPQGHGA